MLHTPQIDHNAPWKRRFRAATIPIAQIAKNNLTRGLVMTNSGASYQLYAWHVPTGELRQLTRRVEGIPLGELSPDGHYIYYLGDKQGNEIGHYVRVPFEGGEPEDITPDLPPYAASGLAFSKTGNKIGMIVANADGFHLYLQDMYDATITPGTPRELYASKRIVRGAVLSHNGEIVVVGSSDHSGNLDLSLLAFDTATGQQIAELWDGSQTGMAAFLFSPLANDFRLLGTTNRSGVHRPFIWNPLTGERTNLALERTGGRDSPG